MADKDLNEKENTDTIFHALRDTDALAVEEKSLQRLTDEGKILVAAGSETTAKSLAFTAFHIINTPGILQKLRAELETTMENTRSKPTWTQLEQLPYLVC